MQQLTMTCRTCRFWDPRYPENTRLGVCTKLGVFLYLDQGEHPAPPLCQCGRPMTKPSGTNPETRAVAVECDLRVDHSGHDSVRVEAADLRRWTTGVTPGYHAALNLSQDSGTPSSDVGVVRTLDDFGCVRHTRVGTHLPTVQLPWTSPWMPSAPASGFV